jgi:hypothetical protein
MTGWPRVASSRSWRVGGCPSGNFDQSSPDPAPRRGDLRRLADDADQVGAGGDGGETDIDGGESFRRGQVVVVGIDESGQDGAAARVDEGRIAAHGPTRGIFCPGEDDAVAGDGDGIGARVGRVASPDLAIDDEEIGHTGHS